MINVRLCRPISKYLRSIKIQGKRTPDWEANKSTAEQFFGKASGTYANKSTAEQFFGKASGTYTLFR